MLKNRRSQHQIFFEDFLLIFCFRFFTFFFFFQITFTLIWLSDKYRIDAMDAVMKRFPIGGSNCEPPQSVQ